MITSFVRERQCRRLRHVALEFTGHLLSALITLLRQFLLKVRLSIDLYYLSAT